MGEKIQSIRHDTSTTKEIRLKIKKIDDLGNNATGNYKLSIMGFIGAGILTLLEFTSAFDSHSSDFAIYIPHMSYFCGVLAGANLLSGVGCYNASVKYQTERELLVKELEEAGVDVNSELAQYRTQKNNKGKIKVKKWWKK